MGNSKASLAILPLLAVSLASPALAEENVSAEPGVEFSLFADAYYTLQSAKPGSVATQTAHRSYAGQGPTGLAENGFSLSFVGLDASYDNGAVGVTTSLRFGSSVPIFNTNDSALGIDNITQGYLTWHATESLDLDVGMFGTIFGAEVAESWQNLNYTRGALYYYGQPFWHTGLRASYAINDLVSVTGMLVNGTNNVSETVNVSGTDDGAAALTDQTPTVAGQVGITPNDNFSVLAGGMLALNTESNDDAGFDTFFDVVASANFGPLSAVFNADYLITAATDDLGDDRAFLGLSGALGYAISDSLGVAGRLEYLTDDDGTGAEAWSLTTGTATLDIKPADNFIVRLDARYESSSMDIYGIMPDGGLGDSSDSWFAAVLGLVVTTSP